MEVEDSAATVANDAPEPRAPDALLAPDAPQVPAASTSDIKDSDHNHIPGAFESDNDMSDTEPPAVAVPEPEVEKSEEATPMNGNPETAPAKLEEAPTDTETTPTALPEDDGKADLLGSEADAVGPASSTEPTVDRAPASTPDTAEEPAPTETPEPEAVSTPDAIQVPSTIITDVDGEVESSRSESPEILVKWNEQGDRIPRKVRDSATKIEQQLVEAEKANSQIPELVSAPRRVSSGEKKVASSDLPLRDYSDTAPPPVSESQTLTLADLDDMMPASPSFLPAPRSPCRSRRSSAASRSRSASSLSLRPPTPGAPPSEHGGSVAGSDGFGEDDFDDFGEEVEGEDFDDFEGFEDGDMNDFDSSPPPPPQVFVPEIPVPILDYSDPDAYRDEIKAAMDKMFPQDDMHKRKPSLIEPRPFLTERRYTSPPAFPPFPY